MFVNYKPTNIFMIITHADIDKPDESFIKGKIASFKNIGGIEIPRENVILFNNTA
jgi:hypothetical protein